VREVLSSIPKRKREAKEFPPFKRKLVGLVFLEFILVSIAAVLYIGFSLKIAFLDFGKLHLSIIAISPVYITFSLLEMLQKFIHGPFSPEISALHESDFADESDSLQIHTSRMDIESSVPFEMQDFGVSSKLENYSGMHASDFQDSSAGESDKRGRWFKRG
jgi:hypothetical protein